MITVLLITARPDDAYVEHPEWHVIKKVLDDLAAQSYTDFELVIIDGKGLGRGESPCFLPPAPKHTEPPTNFKLHQTGGKVLQRRGRPMVYATFNYHSFPVTWTTPRDNLWTTTHRTAICTYRNTGLAFARGDLVVNLDDCCELPPDYLDCFAKAWRQYGVCISPRWVAQGDSRPLGIVDEVQVDGERRPHPSIFGFGSYPLKAALELNGYDEAYDGARGLEDCDWSTRLHMLGVKQALVDIKGFTIHAQGPLDPDCVDPERPVAKCPNRAWYTQRRARHVRKANLASLWHRAGRAIQALCGIPCPLLNDDGTCQHHLGQHPCAYPEMAKSGTYLALEQIDRHPPVFDLMAAREDVKNGRQG